MKTLRELLGLTQEQFARELGIPVRRVSRCESGQDITFRISEIKKLDKLLEQVGLTVHDLPDSLSSQ